MRRIIFNAGDARKIIFSYCAFLRKMLSLTNSQPWRRHSPAGREGTLNDKNGEASRVPAGFKSGPLGRSIGKVDRPKDGAT
jgi:hypothetical protein